MWTCARAGTIAGLLLIAACAEPTAPGTPLTSNTLGSTGGGGGAGAVTVYTQNLFVGADIDGVFNALNSGDQGATLAALAQAVATLDTTDFAARAGAIADEIARTRPHVVGFQEGSQIDIDLTPLGVPLVAHEDFLAHLRSALDARGLDHYVLADSQANLQIHLLGGMVNLIDYDIMLVDQDRVTLTSVEKHHFTQNNGNVGGIDFVRGYILAHLTIGDDPYAAVTVHTEGTDLTAYGIDYHQLHAAQLQDVVDAVAGVETPVLVFGDLNDDDGSAMYTVMTDGGFTDVWAALRPGVEGNTCCRAPDLRDIGPGLARFPQRIDYIFTRGFDHVTRPVSGAITRFGFLPSDRLAGQDGTIWPSDHAGLVANLFAPPGGPTH